MATLTLRVDSLAGKLNGKSREEENRDSQYPATGYEMPTLQDYNDHTRAESLDMPIPQDYNRTREEHTSKIKTHEKQNEQGYNHHTREESIEMPIPQDYNRTREEHTSLQQIKTHEKENKQEYRKLYENDIQNNYLPQTLIFSKNKNESNLQTKRLKANTIGLKQTSSVPTYSNSKRRPRVYNNNNPQSNKVKTAQQNRANRGEKQTASYQNANRTRTFWNSNVESQHAEVNIMDHNINDTPKTEVDEIENTKFVYDLIQLDDNTKLDKPEVAKHSKKTTRKDGYSVRYRSTL